MDLETILWRDIAEACFEHDAVHEAGCATSCTPCLRSCHWRSRNCTSLKMNATELHDTQCQVSASLPE